MEKLTCHLLDHEFEFVPESFTIDTRIVTV
jgi:hypothetical protein